MSNYIEKLEKELLPCPFCGGEPIIWNETDSFNRELYYIQCQGCGLSFNDSWGTYDTPHIEKEVEKWNTRYDYRIEKIKKLKERSKSCIE
jgi:Lar family restriction alleviation protein